MKDDDFIEQASFPVPENAWSWGTWGEWGEWSTTCTRKSAECKAKNPGWQTRERKCLVNGETVCSSWCMPVDDMGLTPMASDRKKYPFTQRVDRVTEPNKDRVDFEKLGFPTKISLLRNNDVMEGHLGPFKVK